MNINMLRYFVAVAEERNFTSAARRLFIAQPSLSQSIRTLEKELGTSLIDRKKTPIRLTQAGELYLVWAKQTIRTQQQIEKQICDSIDGARTSLSVGASSERTRHLLIPIMKDFCTRRPNCSIKIYDIPSAQLMGLLENDQIDIMLTQPIPDSLIYTSELICKEQTLLAVPADHPMNLPKSNDPFPKIDLRRFRESGFVALAPEQMLGRAIRQYCEACGFIPNIKLECRLLTNLHSMIAEGVGVGLVSIPFVDRFRDDRRVRYYSLDFPAEQPVAAVYKKDRYLSKDAEILIYLLKKQEK